MDGVFNVFDAVAVGIILLSALMAFARGMLREVFSILSFLGAGAAAIALLPMAGPLTQGLGLTPLVSNVVAAIAIFLIVFVIISLLTAGIARLAHKNGDIGMLDRILGFVFGAARGVLVLVLFSVVMQQIVAADRLPSWLVQARTYPLLAQATEFVRSLGLGQKVGEYSGKVGDAIKPKPAEAAPAAP
jgi:membrane protein required for colicin V production